MPDQPDNLREALLAQQAPPPDRMDKYRREVQAMLERNEKGLRWERIYVMILWPVYVVICAAFIWVGSARAGTPMSAFFAGLACFWLVFAAIELLKYFINRARVEVLKEIKRVELEVLQLREQLGGKGA